MDRDVRHRKAVVALSSVRFDMNAVESVRLLEQRVERGKTSRYAYLYQVGGQQNGLGCRSVGVCVEMQMLQPCSKSSTLILGWPGWQN